MLKKLKSLVLLMKYARYMGARKFDLAIETLLQARKLTPKSEMIITFLPDVYYQAGRNKEAMEELKEALEHRPNDFEFNRLMVYLLYDSGATVEEMVPYIRIALSNHTEGLYIPWFMKVSKKTKKEFEGLNSSIREWDLWARKVLFDYENR